MATILVTGGAGFIGSNFIHYILAHRPAWVVVNLDKLTYAGNLDNLRDVETAWGGCRYFFTRSDVADRAVVETVFQASRYPRPEAIVHFAAESHVDRSILDASPFIETNVKGTQVLLDAAREYGVRRFVHVSTDEVYGSLTLETGRKFRENDPLCPSSPYSASKAASDLLAAAYHQTYRVPVVITRCCNNYGPYQFPEKLIPLMTLNALEGKSLPVYGDGRYVREWIHVDDHSRAIDFLLDHGTPGEVYNIGSEDEKANLDTVRAILASVAEETQSRIDDLEKLITHVTDRPGHDRRYAIDAGKIRALGWRPVMNWSQGIQETVRWYARTVAWCAKVRSGEYRNYYAKWYGQCARPSAGESAKTRVGVETPA